MKKFFSTYKKIIACLVIGAVLGFGSSTSSYVEAEEYNKLLAHQEEVKSQIVSLEDTIKKEQDNVKLLSEQKVAKEESIKAQLEAEVAKEEAETARVEKEKADKEAAEKAAKEEIKSSTSSVNATKESSKKGSSSSNSSIKGKNVGNKEAIGELVWQSATGSKYHRINNCGNMNPNKAKQITKNEAKAKGLGSCKKCY